jgi:alpha-L-fucosidase
MKSLKECIHTLVRVVGGDGNLLFNVGPMPDGRIEPRQVDRLREMGQWLDKCGQSIYGTRGGPIKTTAWLASTHKGNTVFLHILDWPEETVKLPPLSKRIVDASLLAGEGKLKVRQTDEGIEIEVPPDSREEIDTIIELKLDGPAGDIEPIGIRSASLAAGKRAQASNVFQKNRHYGPDKALDDDPATRWATDSSVTQAWLQVDLGRPETFSRVAISEAYDRVRRFEIQYRADDRWKTILSGERIGEKYARDFEPVTAQHVRLNILEAADGPTIWEFQLMAPKAK